MQISSSKTMNHFAKIVACSSILLSSYSISIAQGNLLISPRRIVFDGSKSTQELNLANTGRDTAKYVVSVVQMRMKEDGNVEQIEKPDQGQNFADGNLRIFPRTVTLAPNEAQVVKVQVTKYSGLASGEYRSHIYFRAVPKSKPLGEQSPTDSSIKVEIVPVFGITVPVIIRVGQSSTNVNVSNLELKAKDANTQLMMSLNRSGNMSVYGDIIVEHVSAQGKSTQVAMAKGVAIYTPNAMRLFSLDLAKGTDIHSGKLLVKYVEQTEKQSKGSAPKVIAESSIALN
jgi:hypothetical protein